MDAYRLTDAEIDQIIAEDAPYGDLTTRLAGISDKPGRITFAARDPLTLSGVEEAVRIFEHLGAQIDFAAEPGLEAKPGTMLLEAHGNAAQLHTGWKVSQILMEWASGIATATKSIVVNAKSAKPNISVVCTRKNAPGTKKLAIKAVLAGGGEIHRFGISDSIMLFAEHRAFLDSPADITAAVAALKARAPEHVVAIEVSTTREALAAQAADVIQLEKFNPMMVRQLVDLIKKRPDGRPVIAPAGGINAKNAAEYAAAGADILVTSSPYQAKPTDIQVRIYNAEAEAAGLRNAADA